MASARRSLLCAWIVVGDAVAAGLLAMLASCGGGEGPRPISEVRVFRPVDELVLKPQDSARRLGYRRRSDRGGSGATETGPALEWDLPAGWTVLPATAMRRANFRVAGHVDTDCYLTVLGGDGGGVRANVNRWRQQMGLAPIDEAAVAILPRGQLLGRPAVLVELSGTYHGKADQSLIALMLGLPFATMTMKMTGPAAVVKAEKEHFLALCRSLRMPAGRIRPAAADSASPGPASSDRGGAAALRWTAPQGWTRGEVRPMRLVTYRLGAAKDVECYAVVLPGAAGGAAANFNRWRGQMGQPPLAAAAIGALPRVSMLGQQAKMLEIEGSYAGMGGPVQKGAMLLGVICELPGHRLFIKMIGPTAAVRAAREQFVRFCESFAASE